MPGEEKPEPQGGRKLCKADFGRKSVDKSVNVGAPVHEPECMYLPHSRQLWGRYMSGLFPDSATDLNRERNVYDANYAIDGRTEI